MDLYAKFFWKTWNKVLMGFSFSQLYTQISLATIISQNVHSSSYKVLVLHIVHNKCKIIQMLAIYVKIIKNYNINPKRSKNEHSHPNA
jgi:hypothetical protein